MFKITIEKIETVESTGRDYKIISDTGNKEDDGPVYDYVTYTEIKEVETKILEQTVEDLDIPTVIKAINSI